MGVSPKLPLILACTLSALVIVISLVTTSIIIRDIYALHDELIRDMEGFRVTSNEAWEDLQGITNPAKAHTASSSAFPVPPELLSGFSRTKRQSACTCAASSNPCPPGLRGPPGFPGESGFPGELGQAGLPGFNPWIPTLALDESGCMICPAGPPGQPGQEGQQGAPGMQGQPGLDIEPHMYLPRPGPPGPPGGRGTTGYPGPPGSPGQPGAPGNVLIAVAGPQGAPGAPGPAGTPGTPGANAGPGLVGPPGPIGPRGIAGVRGPDGPPGGVGVVGLRGEDARYCDCPRRPNYVAPQRFIQQESPWPAPPPIPSWYSTTLSPIAVPVPHFRASIPWSTTPPPLFVEPAAFRDTTVVSAPVVTTTLVPTQPWWLRDDRKRQ